MSKLIAVEYMSMDGVIKEPAWTTPLWNDEHAKFQSGQLHASRALLLGRHTYEGMSKAWLAMRFRDEFTLRMNGIPKYVASTTLDRPEWNAAVLKGDVAQHVARLKGEPGRDLLVYGSGTLVNYLIQHNLVDELKLLVHPVVAGGGRRLFHENTGATAWTLAGTSVFSSGDVVLDYRPTSPPLHTGTNAHPGPR
ncbi:pyrimidine reductase [Streptomyces albus subsp. albus]|nr:pyrimidine reductase [Streptomyces albus subsp. albus]